MKREIELNLIGREGVTANCHLKNEHEGFALLKINKKAVLSIDKIYNNFRVSNNYYSNGNVVKLVSGFTKNNKFKMYAVTEGWR